MKTYAIKWEEKILVTSQNKDELIWYTFIQEELTERDIEIKQIKDLIKKWEELRVKYLSIQTAEPDEITSQTLQILETKWEEIKTQVKALQWELITKYWVEILEEILF